MKVIPLLLILITITFHSFSQDKLVLNNDSVIFGRITSADSSSVEILKSSRPNGPEYIFRRSEIKKVILGNGKTILYPHSFEELSLGISTSLVYYKNDNIKSPGTNYFNNKLIGLSFIDRTRVLSIGINLGYSWIYKEATNVNSGSHGYTSYSYDTLNTNSIFGSFLIRANFSRKELNPYLHFSFGVQGDRVDGYAKEKVNIRLGMGLQYKIKMKYLIEAEFGLNIRSEDESSYYENPGANIFSYFGFNIYRIISTTYQ